MNPCHEGSTLEEVAQALHTIVSVGVGAIESLETEIERVTPADVFEDGELVVWTFNDGESSLAKVEKTQPNGSLGVVWLVTSAKSNKDNWEMSAWDKEHITKPTIGSQFTTKCDNSIYPSGKGEFVVVDMERPAKSGEFYLEDWGVAGKATCDWGKSTTAFIVLPCDLAYYAKTAYGIAYVMYELCHGGHRLLTSEGADYTFFNKSGDTIPGLLHGFIRSLDLTPVPLSVSAITGIVAPKVGV